MSEDRDPELEKILAKKARELMVSTKKKLKPNFTSEGKVIKLTSKNFDGIINNAKVPVLVDFWAEWCLASDTKLVANPTTISIGNVEKGFKVLSFDREYNETVSTVTSTHKVFSKDLVEIITERGRRIVCTPEHLLLTNEGWTSADALKKDHLLAVYPFSYLCPEISNDERVFLDEQMIRITAAKLGLENEKYIQELRERNLCELKYNDERSYILASLIGFVLTDGSLSICENNERMVEFSVGNEKDKDELIKDIKKLGYRPFYYLSRSKGIIGKREFIQTSIRVKITKTSFFLLLASLGAVIGDKFIKGIKIPEWILNGPKEIKRAFLQGFLGGDGPRVTTSVIKRTKRVPYNKVSINPIQFHFYKFSENSYKTFVRQLCSLLEDMGVKIRKVVMKEEKLYKRKDKRESTFIKIYINTSFRYAFSYASIGFKYAFEKKFSTALAREYMLERIRKHEERKAARNRAIEMFNRGIAINEIRKKLKKPYIVVKNWINGCKANPIQDAIVFYDWLKKYFDNDRKMFFDPIRYINRVSGELFEFISLSLDNDTKMFVANDVIHHNCMPCRMMAPVVEALAQKYAGKVIVAKLNVDENPDIAQRYYIMGIPTFIIFKNGKPVEKIVGAVGQRPLENALRKFLAK